VTGDDSETIRQIEQAAQGTEPISANRVKTWMLQPSLEVQGELVLLMLQHSHQIEPPLTMKEICRAVQSYYRRCLIENLQQNDHVPNRHVAGYELVRWFSSLWRDTTVPREYLVELREMLRQLLIEDKVPQEEIVTAVLEHLFEIPEIADFFTDWKSNPKLAGAIALASEWVEKSPKSAGGSPLD